MQPSEIKAPPLPYSKVQAFFLDRFLKKITHKRLFGTQEKLPICPRKFPKKQWATLMAAHLLLPQFCFDKRTLISYK